MIKKQLKKAEMSFLGWILSFSLLLLFMPVFEYYQTSENTNIATINIENMLENVCQTDGIKIFNTLKYVSARNMAPVADDNYLENCKNLIFEKLGYEKDINIWTAPNNITITNVNLEYDNANMKFILTYKLTTPIKILNATVANPTVSKTATAQIMYKN